MPTEAQIKAATSRRLKRKEAREQAVETAREEDQNFSDILAEGRSKKAETKPEPKLSRKEKIAAQRRAAEKEAHEQDKNLRTPTPDIDKALQANVRTGENVPLHVLNALASKHANEIKDEAREIANAAGKAAFATATGIREQKRRPSRHTNMRDAQARAEQIRKSKA